MTQDGPKLGVLGIDHGHIFGMLGHMKAAGCSCAKWWTDGQAVTETKFREVFPDLERVDDRRRILEDPDIDMVLPRGEDRYFHRDGTPYPRHDRRS